ncbi:calpain-1 catalytic subunit-like [Rhinichthys klamathensis goyatoka]|uniref:calpain-1 catalytic subunit-like n=1 Tax=Rhinichthys klamathensis goyatoka TaxID=3034132 RepID=UPI0024B6194C|nr:calpain-1 catalytic subunit-like [Rhinichthys klamathensis goyatoka]
MPPPRVNRIARDEQPTRDKTGTLDVPLKFLDQDYQELKKSCFTNNRRYVDEKFPSDSSSIDPKKKLGLDMEQIKWLRPSKIVADPQLIVKGVSRFDYSQGSYLGDCWFLASVGALTFQEDVMDQVMPVDQSFGEDYAGIFRFRFWRFGKWIDVVIDDKLPTINGKLIFVHSKTSNEFWPALLEKAYAKVCGSYADMHAGLVSEALLDFTGGVHVHYETATTSIDLWSLMHRAAKAKALMACGTFLGKTSENTVLPNGIVQGHAYTVTGVYKVQCQKKTVQLVRVLNPWGKGEWTGDWSDKSSLWDKVSEKEQTRCRSLANDGEFWMSMEDFTKNFEDIDICCLSPDFLDSSSECRWTSTCYKDSWVDGTTAGGCLNNKDSFWTNPQFRVRIEELDKECSGQCPENILVSLMQNHEKRNRSEVSNYAIGFNVFAIPPEMKDVKLPDKFFYRKRPIASSGNFINARHVMKFFKLEPGEYLIVPAPFNPKECAKFILSIFSKSESHKRNKKPEMTYV